MKVIHFNPLDPASIDNAIKEVKAFQKWIEEKTKELLRRLAERGCEISRVNFSPANAMYDGTNDVTCDISILSDHLVAVIASGNATLFIEFGTGILWPDTHPENQYVRGEYGYGLGKLAGGWYYDGDPGSNGEVIAEGKHAGKVHTYGNPANASMYLAIRQLEREFAEIAKEVFV